MREHVQRPHSCKLPWTDQRHPRVAFTACADGACFCDAAPLDALRAKDCRARSLEHAECDSVGLKPRDAFYRLEQPISALFQDQEAPGLLGTHLINRPAPCFDMKVTREEAFTILEIQVIAIESAEACATVHAAVLRATRLCFAGEAASARGCACPRPRCSTARRRLNTNHGACWRCRCTPSDRRQKTSPSSKPPTRSRRCGGEGAAPGVPQPSMQTHWPRHRMRGPVHGPHMLHSRAHAAPCAAMHHRHPDKNPDNDEATTKFQQISAAYARLSNPDASDDELDDVSGPPGGGGEGLPHLPPASCRRRQEAGGRRQEAGGRSLLWQRRRRVAPPDAPACAVCDLASKRPMPCAALLQINPDDLDIYDLFEEMGLRIDPLAFL